MPPIMFYFRTTGLITKVKVKAVINYILGEHSESVGGVYDISNKLRLGKTEFELVSSMCVGIKVLLDAEFKMN